jgi:hypothetical protein
LDQNRDRKQPFQRPNIYLAELEAEHPRRKTGIHKWYGPVRPDGGDRTKTEDVYETDEEYLSRLGLLEPWEKEVLSHVDQ